MRFPPSVVATKHGWRTAMHLEGRNEVKNRNGACVMEVASLGSRAKIATKEGGKPKSSIISAECSEAECRRGLIDEVVRIPHHVMLNT
jgi:hypothetical protein